MKTNKLIVWILILSLIFISGSANPQILVDKFFNLKLYSSNVNTTVLKSGKSETKNYDSYFFVTKSGIYDSDEIGLYFLKFVEYPTFKYTYAATGEVQFETVVANTIDESNGKECLFTLNKHINAETYIITLRYETHLLKFECKSLE